MCLFINEHLVHFRKKVNAVSMLLVGNQDDSLKLNFICYRITNWMQSKNRIQYHAFVLDKINCVTKIVNA